MSSKKVTVMPLKQGKFSEYEERQIFTQFEKFLTISHYSVCKNFDYGPKISLKTKRFAFICLVKMLSIMLGIRSALNIFWPTPYIRDLTCNAYHYLGSQIMINMVFLGGVISANMMLSITNQYFNLTGQSYMFQYMNKVKYRTLEYELKGRFRDRYFGYFNVCANMVSTQFLPNCMLFTLIYCTPTVIGYFDPELNFSLIGVIFWIAVMAARIWEFVAILFNFFSVWSLCTLGLKYQFEQVNQEMSELITNKQFWRLPVLFRAHHRIEQETLLMNKEMKYYIFVFYKIIKPCFNILVYISLSPKSSTILWIFATFEAILIGYILFGMHYLCAAVTTAAHKIQPLLYDSLLAPNQRIPLSVRMKMIKFIERLSGPEIGFYCYDLFPMTSYNFADYVLDSISSFFLILKLFKRVRLI